MEQKSRVWSRTILTALAVVGALGAAAVPEPRDEERDAKRPSCCVANPRYAGICAVDLAPGESCADVVAYLNNAASVGKTYCGNTPIRGGWKQVKCQEAEE